MGMFQQFGHNSDVHHMRCRYSSPMQIFLKHKSVWQPKTKLSDRGTRLDVSKGWNCTKGRPVWVISALCAKMVEQKLHTPQTCLVWHSRFDSSTLYVLFSTSCILDLTFYIFCLVVWIILQYCNLCFEANRSELHARQTCLAWYPHSDPSTLCISYILYSVFFFISCNQNWYYCILYFDG